MHRGYSKQSIGDVLGGEYAKLGLKLNYEKTVIILYENYPKGLIGDPEWATTTLNAGEHLIEPQPQMKYLSVIVDNRLRFEEIC